MNSVLVAVPEGWYLLPGVAGRAADGEADGVAALLGRHLQAAALEVRLKGTAVEEGWMRWMRGGGGVEQR